MGSEAEGVGRTRAIDAAFERTSLRLEQCVEAIDAALDSGHLIVRDDRFQCGGIGVCGNCTEQFERLEARVRGLEGGADD